MREEITVKDLADNWWLAIVRGVCGIAFGVLCAVWPIPSLFALVILYGIYMLFDGGGAIGLAIGSRRQGRRPVWPLVVVGVLSIAAGLTALVWPGLSAFVLLVVIASWAIVRGVFEIIASIRLRKKIEHEWALGLAGACSIVFGALLLRNPAAGALAVVWLIGAFAIAFGILNLMLGFQLRSLKKRVERRPEAPHPPMTTPAPV
jgi:uncharacterized membrane protein HdeD (DUF308 family)